MVIEINKPRRVRMCSAICFHRFTSSLKCLYTSHGSLCVLYGFLQPFRTMILHHLACVIQIAILTICYPPSVGCVSHACSVILFQPLYNRCRLTFTQAFVLLSFCNSKPSRNYRAFKLRKFCISMPLNCSIFGFPSVSIVKPSNFSSFPLLRV